MSVRFITLPPIFRALTLQLMALGLLWLALRVTAFAVTPWFFVITWGVLAALLSRLAQLERWWLPIQLLFPLAVLAMLVLDLNPVWYLAALALLVLVYWSTFRTRVPLYLSNRKVWQQLLRELPPAGGERRVRFVDLGCGVGGLIGYLAAQRPDAQFVGVEVAPLPMLCARLRMLLSRRSNARILWDSLWSCDLARYDVVFAFLSPVPMPDLWRKVRAEMRPGTLFISSSFPVPGVKPARELTVADARATQLYLYRR
ncbi:MAG: class I SAM-dependent methyltransferase [Steroidobacteraceae bacterium]